MPIMLGVCLASCCWIIGCCRGGGGRWGRGRLGRGRGRFCGVVRDFPENL